MLKKNPLQKLEYWISEVAIKLYNKAKEKDSFDPFCGFIFDKTIDRIITKWGEDVYIKGFKKDTSDQVEQWIKGISKTELKKDLDYYLSNTKEHMDNLVELFMDGEVVFFIGNGMSIAAGATKHIDKIATDILFRKDELSMRDVNLFRVNRTTNYKLIKNKYDKEFKERVKSEFDRIEPALPHYITSTLIASSKVTKVVCFNYDCLIEEAYEKLYGKQLKEIKIYNHSSLFSEDEIILRKVHGCVSKPNGKWIYPHQEGRIDDFMKKYLESIPSFDPIVIVGYSFQDEYVKKYFNKELNMEMKFLVDVHPSKSIITSPWPEVKADAYNVVKMHCDTFFKILINKLVLEDSSFRNSIDNVDREALYIGENPNFLSNLNRLKK